jgi:lysophospholipase L1-like esterase
VNNQGVNGRQLIDEGVVEAIIESANTSDVLIIALGTNDWGSDGGQLGTITDTDTATFYGALNTLKTAFDTKDIKVIFVTPLGRHQAEVNQHGGTLADFGQAIKNIFGGDVGGKYTVVDGFDIVGIDEIDRYAQDGLHVNEDGHALIAKAILSAMKNTFGITNNN